MRKVAGADGLLRNMCAALLYVDQSPYVCARRIQTPNIRRTLHTTGTSKQYGGTDAPIRQLCGLERKLQGAVESLGNSSDREACGGCVGVFWPCGTCFISKVSLEFYTHYRPVRRTKRKQTGLERRLLLEFRLVVGSRRESRNNLGTKMLRTRKQL